MVVRINTVAFNGTQGLLRKTIPTILGVAVFFCNSFPVYAFSCLKESSSIEKAYIKADTVFSGTMIGNNEDGSALFLVNEYYKSSSPTKPPEVSVSRIPYAKTDLPTETELVIYGEYEDGSPHRVTFSACDKSKIAPGTIQDWSTDPEKKKQLDSLGPILLLGKVLEAKHVNIGHSKKTKYRSEIKIQIQRIYSNPLNELSLVEGSEIRMDIGFCGQEMIAGREYIISAKRGKLRIENGRRLDPQVDILEGICTNMFPMDVKEREILRNLSILNEEE